MSDQSTIHTKRKFKKRYLLLGLFLIFVLSINSGMFAFRKSDEDITKQLSEMGQEVSFHFYDYKERKMHYAQVGQGEKDQPLVLFLHGSPGALDAYIDYLGSKRLSEQANLVAVDRPGFGWSDFGKVEVSLSEQAAAIYPIIESLSPSQTILVGHSFGGPVAVRMAIDYPEAVDGMVLVAASIDPLLEPPTWWRSLLNIWGIRWLVPTALRVCNQEILPLEGELNKMMPHWDKVSASAIVIQGDEDSLVPPGNADFAEKMMKEKNEIEIDKIEGGNHFILWSETERITNAILKILKPQKQEEPE